MIEDWVEQCRRGHSKAYAKIVEALQGRLLDFLYRMTQNRELAEDLGQEAFLRAFRLLDRYDQTSPLGCLRWLATCASMSCANAGPIGFSWRRRRMLKRRSIRDRTPLRGKKRLRFRSPTRFETSIPSTGRSLFSGNIRISPWKKSVELLNVRWVRLSLGCIEHGSSCRRNWDRY